MNLTISEKDVLNYIDIKLHDVHNIPPSWFAEAKPPAFNEHPFRYEVSFSFDGEKWYTFTHGRILQALPHYESYIENAQPPMPPSLISEMLRNTCEVPGIPPLGNSLSPKVGLGLQRKSLRDITTVETKIIGITTPASDATAVNNEDLGSKRRKRVFSTSTTDDIMPPNVPSADDPPPCIIRVPLGLQELSAVETLVKTQKPLELHFTRVLKSGLRNDLEDTQEWYFRAIIPVDLSPLAEPGSLSLRDVVQLVPQKKSLQAEEKSKKKTQKRSKSLGAGILFEQSVTDAQHPYLAHQTSATVSVKLEKTVVMLASDRVRPSITPANLIPTRAAPKEAYRDSTQKFIDLVEIIAKRIMIDYANAKNNNPETTQEVIFERFQTSGQLAAYEKQLVPLVIEVIQEKFVRDTNATPATVSQLTNELYVYLLDRIHTSLRNISENPGNVDESAATENINHKGKEKEKEKSSNITGSLWLERAEEAETLRDYGMAARCHQARIASCSSYDKFPDVWNDAAVFFVRVGELTQAEQCYREAIAHNPLHVPSLLGYGDLLLTYGRFDEAAVFLHAAVDVEPSPLTWGHILLLCDLHVLSQEHGPDYEIRRAYWEREGSLAIKEAINATEEVDFHTVATTVIEHLLKLQYIDLANVFLTHCPAGARTEVLYAQLFAISGQYKCALESIQNGVELEPYAEEIAILRGKCYAALGHEEEAVQEYKRVLCGANTTPKRCHGPSYIHLGNLLITAGRYKDALGVFTLGIQAWPCSLMWLGAGIAYYRMGKLDAAEECLSESNTINKTNPRTWAYLSLVCLKKERAELNLVLQQTITQGLADAALLTELGRELVRASRLALGEECLRKVLALKEEAGQETSDTYCISMFYLAAAIENKNREEARQLYTNVVNCTTNEVLRARADEQLLLLA